MHLALDTVRSMLHRVFFLRRFGHFLFVDSFNSFLETLEMQVIDRNRDDHDSGYRVEFMRRNDEAQIWASLGSLIAETILPRFFSSGEC